MRTLFPSLPGSVIFGVLAFVLAFVLAACPAFAAELTDAERAFVREAGPVSFCVDPDWPPYEVISPQGTHEGIAADLLRLAAGRVGLTLVLHPTRDWDESLAASRAGKCTLLSFLNQTPKREEWLIFTEPLFTDPNVIVTRESHPFIADLAGVSEETMVLPKGTSVEERLRRDYPNLSILTTDSEAEAFSLVSKGKADMTMRSMIVAVHTIKKDGWFNLKIAGQVPGYENRLRVGVAKHQTMLRDILNKGIASITPTESAQIANRHVAINVQTAVDYVLIRNIILIFAAILGSNLFWILRLRKSNRQLHTLSRTDRLTGLANRASVNERFLLEIGRAARHGRALSVLLMDIDHFKRINDELGHIMGDRVLVAFAGIARNSVRACDMVARWGGEEFLILCPETTTDHAMLLARRICDTVRTHPFESGRHHTVSVGVASFHPGDTVDTLLHRADEALYLAKNGGRDQTRSL